MCGTLPIPVPVFCMDKIQDQLDNVDRQTEMLLLCDRITPLHLHNHHAKILLQEPVVLYIQHKSSL